MYAVLFASLLLLSLSALAQNTEAPQQNSAFVPSFENYNNTNAFERSPDAVDALGSNKDQIDDESQKPKMPADSQNMPVDQD